MSAPVLLAQGDITAWDADVIITPASHALTSRDGLNGLVIDRGGPQLLERLGERAEVDPGDVYLTPGFSLPARHVVHAVSPVWSGGLQGEPALLEACLRKAFAVVRVIGGRTVGCAALGTGTNRIPPEVAAAVSVRVAVEELARSPDIEDFRFVVLGDEVADRFRACAAAGLASSVSARADRTGEAASPLRR